MYHSVWCWAVWAWAGVVSATGNPARSSPMAATTAVYITVRRTGAVFRFLDCVDSSVDRVDLICLCPSVVSSWFSTWGAGSYGPAKTSGTAGPGQSDGPIERQHAPLSVRTRSRGDDCGLTRPGVRCRAEPIRSECLVDWPVAVRPGLRRVRQFWGGGQTRSSTTGLSKARVDQHR